MRSKLHFPALIGLEKPRRKSGFTLVELLVVIVIIATLAAIAIASTGRLKKKAMQVKAMNSLRQVAGFSASYSMEHNGDINTLRWEGDPKEGGGGKWVSNTFWGRLQPYFADVSMTNQKNLKRELHGRLDRLFNSPDANTMVGTFISSAKIYHDTSGLPVPISFNSSLHKWGRFVKVSSLGNPSQIIYATYGFGFCDEDDGINYVPVPTDKSQKLGSSIYYFDDKTVAASFVDGHIEVITPSIPGRRFE